MGIDKKSSIILCFETINTVSVTAPIDDPILQLLKHHSTATGLYEAY